MIVTVARPARWPVDAAMFADITTKEITRLGWSTDTGGDSVFEVQFAVNLTQAETDAVTRRLSTGGTVEETLQARAVDAYADLLAFENTTSPTNAQTLAVVKLLCKVVRAMMRIQFRRLDAAD